MSFRERLKQWRESRGWSQAELASRTNVSNRSISRWEVGDGLPGGETLVELAQLGCDVGWLLTGRHSGQAPSQTMNPTTAMPELDAIEEKLAETTGIPIDIANMTDEQAEMYATLQHIVATTSDDRDRARADLYLKLVWADLGASARQKTRETAVFSRIRRASEIVSRAEADLGWTAPMPLREAMKALVFEYDISEESAREALDMICHAWLKKD